MRSLAAILFTVVSGGFAFADGLVVLQGRVVDGKGAPVADAEVATTFEDRLGSMAASTSARSRDDGGFRFRIHLHGRPQVVIVLDADRLRGAIAPIVSGLDLNALDLKLEPLGTVLGDVGCKDLGRGAERTVLTLLRLPQRAPVATRNGGPGGFRFLLPPGRYLLTAKGGADHRGAERTLEVPAGGGELELGAVFLEGRGYTKLWGEKAPAWKIGAVRGLKGNSEPFTLASLRDKWVLLLFCDARSGASREALKTLEAFWSAHAPDRDRFAVVAFHAAWAKSFEAVDAVLGETGLTFPLVLDPSGETQKAFGVEEAPRLLLVDPDGYLVPGDEAFVAKHFRR